MRCRSWMFLPARQGRNWTAVVRCQTLDGGLPAKAAGEVGWLAGRWLVLAGTGAAGVEIPLRMVGEVAGVERHSKELHLHLPFGGRRAKVVLASWSDKRYR